MSSEEGERQRSLAAFRRRTEKEKRAMQQRAIHFAFQNSGFEQFKKPIDEHLAHAVKALFKGPAMFDGERSAGRERAVDAIAPLTLIGVRVVRVEEHPPAGLVAAG